VNDAGRLLDDVDIHGATLSKQASDTKTGNGSSSTKTRASIPQNPGRHRESTEPISRRAPLKNAQDYFITKRAGFPWSTIPALVVGRAGVDNWLVATALGRRRAAVVDASRTVSARHQVRRGYDPSAHYRQAGGDATINYLLAGRSFDYSLGLTDCAPLHTAHVDPPPSAAAAASSSGIR